MIFIEIFLKNTQKCNFKNIRPVGGRSYSIRTTDRQTDVMKLIVAFRNSAKGPVNYIQSHGFTSTVSSWRHNERDEVLH